MNESLLQTHAVKNVDTLLLVDDEANILSSLQRLLRKEGYRILTAQNGVDALQILENEYVDVIVSDQRMPQMTGTEFLKQARNIYPDTVRIVLSGYTDLESVTSAINEGAVYKFLTKPWNDEHLKLNIIEAFRHKHINDENCRLQMELADLNLKLSSLLQEKEDYINLAETSLLLAKEIITNLSIAIIAIDQSNVVVMANNAAHSILGISLIGKSAHEVFPQPLYEKVSNKENMIYQAENGFNYNVDYTSLNAIKDITGYVVTLSKINIC